MILALALAAAVSAAPAAAAAADTSSAPKAAPATPAARAARGLTVPIPYLVPPSLAVPKVDDEAARVIVADTLNFPWPPADSAAAPKEPAKTAPPPPDAPKPADAADATPPPDAPAPAADTAAADAASVEPKAAEAPPPIELKRPRSRQELNKMSSEELFRLAFGRDAPEKPRNLTVRLFGEGRPVGGTELAYNETFTAFTFRSMAFSRLLDRMILPEARAAAGDSMGRFSSEALEAADYTLRVDDANFELHVSFPPGDKGVQYTDLYGGYRAEEPRGDEIPAAGVSFYLNYSLDDRGRYLWYGGGAPPGAYGRGDTLMRDPANLNFDGALNVRGWIFESSGWVREPSGGGPFTWDDARRDDARLVRNFERLRSQLAVGDIIAGGAVVPGPLAGGARYERNSYFFGRDPRDSLNSVSFFMPEPGEVEVYADGVFRRRFYLPAGHHRVGGFGGSAGRNRVRLLLRSASGATEEVPFEYVLSNPRVMARGDVRYVLAAGVRRQYAPSPACFAYDVSEPLASVDYAYGIHHAVNAGLSAVASRRAARGGLQLSFGADGFGFVDARFVTSYFAPERRAGERAEGSYTADLKRATARFNRFVTGDPNKSFLPPMTFALRGYYQTEHYSLRMFDEPAGAAGAAGGASGNFSAALWRGSLSAFGGVNFYRETGFEAAYNPYDYNYGVRLSQSFGKSYFAASAGESVRDGVRSPYFLVNSSHAFGADVRVRGHRFSAGANAGMYSRYLPAVPGDSAFGRADTTEIEWSYGGDLGWRWSNDAAPGSWTQAYTADVRYVNDETPSASATLRHAYNRARLDADYDLVFSNYTDYDRQNHTLRAELAGSFMYADGLWALGQPISGGGGFVLVDTRGDLGGARVHINRSRATGSELSRSGLLGAAYHNRLLAYSPNELTLSLTGVREGAFLEQSRYYAVGGYKQGFALKIGRQAQVIARVPFVEKRGGRPLGHVYLTVGAELEGAEAPEDAPRAPRPAFTGENGTLQMGGLTPGRKYRIKFRPSSRLRDAVIEIPEDAEGIYEHSPVEVEKDE